MSNRVEMDLVLPHPPKRVWRALTDPALLAEWLMTNDFRPLVGRRFRFRPGSALGLGRDIACQILEMETERRLTYSWRDETGGLPDLVTWTLEPVAEGTRLRLEHTQGITAKAVDNRAVTRLVAASTLWCGAAIRLQRALVGRLVMGRVVVAGGESVVRAISLRRIDGANFEAGRCVTC